MSDSKTTQALREIRMYVSESAKGFLTAADTVADPDLGHDFREIAEVRRQHADEVAPHLPEDEREEEGGLASAKLHRWWIQARASLQNGDARAILGEVLRGEDQLAEVYGRRITDGFPEAEVDELVRKQQKTLDSQRRNLKAMHDRLDQKS